MQAVILAGGFGTRLRPLTDELPKPMIPVANEPLLYHTLMLLKSHGITDVGITVMYLPQYIKSRFGDGEELGMHLSYFEENQPLGTAGSVKQAEEFLDEDFLVISGDALTDINIEKVMLYHKEKHALATVVAKRETCPLEYGVIQIASDGKIEGFSEKPQWESVTSDTVNTGIYILKKSVLDKIPQNTEYDFGKNLFPKLMTEKAEIYAYITEDYWCDLGTHLTYLNANFDILSGKIGNAKTDILTGENLTLAQESKLIAPVMIGKNVTVRGNCVVGPNAVIGDGCVIENSTVQNSVIWDFCKIKDTETQSCIIASKAEIDGGVLSGNNVIGQNAKVLKNAHLGCGAKVYGNITVERNSILKQDVVAPLNSDKKYFNNGKITGMWGLDISPGVLEGLAASIKEEKIFVGYSDTSFSASCAHLLSSYLSLSGKDSYLIKTPESAFRYFACVNGTSGIYIYSDFPDLELQVIDKNGLNISPQEEKKINFSLRAQGQCKKVIRLDSQEKQFEYFLNTSFPFMRSDIRLFSKDKYKLHNIIYEKQKDFNLPEKGVFIFAPKGRIVDIYVDGERISATDFYAVKIDLTELLGAKEVFLPVYAPKETVDYALKKGLKILKTFEHKGSAMQQAEKFNSVACLLEFEPAFFALAYCFYSERLKTGNRGGILAEYTFDCEREKTASTVFLINKKSKGFVTVVPKNDGYSFSVYKKFALEEYAPDNLDGFVNGILDKN